MFTTSPCRAARTETVPLTGAYTLVYPSRTAAWFFCAMAFFRSASVAATVLLADLPGGFGPSLPLVPPLPLRPDPVAPVPLPVPPADWSPLERAPGLTQFL